MNDLRPQATSSMVGELLGSYRVVGELSTGGMGTVYRAQHELLGRPAAIKLLRPELTTSEELVERFFNEAKAATAIRHPGIVEVYDFGYTDDGRAYLVMEFLDGEPLGKRLERCGRLSEREAADIARGIASALKAAHAKGIVHRDLKPDNVFLVPDPDGGADRVKVLDFGIAKLAEPSPRTMRQTQTGVLMGTPLYMAPEQARAAGTIDHRADQYSLGCILYEMLVGKPPFVAEGAGEIIALQMFGEVEPPSQRLAEITPAMEALVLRLLEKEPHARFDSTQEIQQVLMGLGSGLPSRPSAERIGVVPTSGPRQISPTPLPSRHSSLRVSLLDPPQAPADKRGSSAPLLLGLAVVVIAAIIGIVVLRDRGAEPAAPPQRAPAATVTPVTPSPTVTPTRPTAPPEPPLAPRPTGSATPAPEITVVSSGDDAPASKPAGARPTTGKPGTGAAKTVPSNPNGSASPRKGDYTPGGSPMETTLD